MKAGLRALAGLAVVGLAGDAQPGSPAAGGGALLLLYVGAEDCAPCLVWRREHKPGFLRGSDPERVRYREVIAPRIAQALDERTWPVDLRPFRAGAAAQRGLPLWLVVRGDRILATAGGLSSWRTRVLPLLRREAARG